MAQSYSHQGLFNDAHSCIDKVIDASALNLPYILLHKANYFQSQKKYDESIQTIDKIFLVKKKKSFPDTADTKDYQLYNKKGLIFLEQEKYQEATKNFDEALQLEKQDSKIWFNQGLSLKFQQESDRALEYFDKALGLNPANKIDILREKAFVLHYQKKLSMQAVQCLTAALRIDSKRSDIWNLKGYYLKQMKEYKEAMICFNKAIEFNKDFVEAWSNKGHTFKALGESEKALEAIIQVFKLDPENNDALELKQQILGVYTSEPSGLQSKDAFFGGKVASVPEVQQFQPQPQPQKEEFYDKKFYI